MAIGSIKPAETNAPVWLRSLLIAQVIHRLPNPPYAWERSEIPDIMSPDVGILLAFEAPTPRNDFLTSINRIGHRSRAPSTNTS